MPERRTYNLQCMSQYIRIRKIKNMTAADVAELTGISLASIRSYESGRRSPSLAYMELMAKAVGGTGIGIEGWT
jgi:transcriptional regulator with XRE-family HTH domain